MFDTATTALPRAVLGEVCGTASHSETGTPAHVASKLLEAATRGETTPDTPRLVGRKALSEAPTMWR